jgi:RecA/RadA recombinase
MADRVITDSDYRKAMDAVNEVFRAAGVEDLLVSLDTVAPWQFVSSGVPWLDGILGYRVEDGEAVGGFPVGGVVELFGDPGACKTKTAWKVAAEYLVAGRRVLWLGSEGIDVRFAKKLGVKTDDPKLRMVPDMDAVKQLQILKMMIPVQHLIVVDSMAELITDKQFNGDVERTSNAVGLAVNAWMHKVHKMALDNGTTILLLGQRRDFTVNGHTVSDSTGGSRKDFAAWARVFVTLVRQDWYAGPQAVLATVRKRRGSGPIAVLFDQRDMSVIASRTDEVGGSDSRPDGTQRKPDALDRVIKAAQAQEVQAA